MSIQYVTIVPDHRASVRGSDYTVGDNSAFRDAVNPDQSAPESSANPVPRWESEGYMMEGN